MSLSLCLSSMSIKDAFDTMIALCSKSSESSMKFITLCSINFVMKMFIHISVKVRMNLKKDLNVCLYLYFSYYCS